MTSDFVAFLRAISNVPMQPFRDALLNAGFSEVGSYGGTGNLFFSSPTSDRAELEQRVEQAVGAESFVRSRIEVAAIVRDDPFAGRPGATVFLARGTIDPDRVATLLAGGFEEAPPVVSGAQVYFVHPLQRPGRRSTINLERELGIRGTLRASRVVSRIHELM